MIWGLGKLPPNCVIQFPSKTWGFVGSVDVRLGYLLDGNVVETDEQAKEVLKYHGLPFQKRVKTRTYPTKEAAEAAALALGLTVTPTKSESALA
jgi:hypothetical protein